MRQFTLCNGSQVVNFASLSLYHYPFSMPGGESLCSHPQFFISMSADNSARCDLGATHRHPNTGNSLAPWLPATTLSIQDLCSIGTLDALLFPCRQLVVSAGSIFIGRVCKHYCVSKSCHCLFSLAIGVSEHFIRYFLDAREHLC